MANFTRVRDNTSRQARAERILDAASVLLLRHGYKRVTIDDVAEHAGIGKGTLYLHYTTREALFYAVIARELAMALDELVATLRRDPEAALLHRLMRAYFLTIMNRPLVRAAFVGDLEVLGKLAKGLDSGMEIQHALAMRDYVRSLVEHGLVRADLAIEDLLYAVRATARGFFLVEALDGKRDQLALERKADLLEITIQRAFGADGAPSPDAVRAVAPQAIHLFSEVADIARAQVRRSYG